MAVVEVVGGLIVFGGGFDALCCYQELLGHMVLWGLVVVVVMVPV